LGHIGIDILFSCLSDQKKTSAEGATEQLTIKNIYVCILLPLPLCSDLQFLQFFYVVVVVVVVAAAVIVDNKNKIIIIIIVIISFLLLLEYMMQSCDRVKNRSHKFLQLVTQSRLDLTNSCSL
jgi:hypothetical protein